MGMTGMMDVGLLPCGYGTWVPCTFLAHPIIRRLLKSGPWRATHDSFLSRKLNQHCLKSLLQLCRHLFLLLPFGHFNFWNGRDRTNGKWSDVFHPGILALKMDTFTGDEKFFHPGILALQMGMAGDDIEGNFSIQAF